MTAFERIANILQRKPVDRIGTYEHFWNDTKKKWVDDGYIQEDEDLQDHFNLDLQKFSAFNTTANLDFEPEVVAENEDTITVRDGNGAILRRHKHHDTTPEHVDFLVKERKAWEEHIKPHLLEPDYRRIDFAGYRDPRRYAKGKDRFSMWSGNNVFELMHPVCGHENMLAGMALDPEWIKDMVRTYAELTIKLQEILFEKEGPPDGIWYFEDLGFKHHPFLSSTMYREIIQPGHKRSIGFAKSLNLPTVMHSCGYVEPLIPEMIEAGIDCLQVIEIKAGMDLVRLSFMGGIDVRVLYTNDRAKIDAELEANVPIVKQNYGYVLHSDHSIPNTVEHEIYHYFVERGRKLGAYD